MLKSCIWGCYCKWYVCYLFIFLLTLYLWLFTSLLAEYSSSLPALLLAEISIDFNWSKQSEYSSHSQSTQSTLSNKLCHKPIKPSHYSLQNVLTFIWLTTSKCLFLSYYLPVCTISVACSLLVTSIEMENLSCFQFQPIFGRLFYHFHTFFW